MERLRLGKALGDEGGILYVYTLYFYLGRFRLGEALGDEGGLDFVKEHLVGTTAARLSFLPLGEVPKV